MTGETPDRRGDEATLTIESERGFEDARDETPRLVVAMSSYNPLASGMPMSLVDVDSILIGRGVDRDLRRHARTMSLTLDDVSLSRRHAELKRSSAGWELRDLGSKNGCFVCGERCVHTVLADGDVIEMGSTFLVFRESGGAGERLLAGHNHVTMNVDVARAVLALDQVASTDLPVIVRGETGAGKEWAALRVHNHSGRRGAFVAVNCGALPRSLLESELFGYRSGAFSGAKGDRDGLVRQADGGTLFLDEVAELHLDSQVALLRVLQEGEVRPVGAGVAQRVDLRVVAATHQDLAAMVRAGRFREDLYARLAGFEAYVLPLRERREDIGGMIAGILRRMGGVALSVTIHALAARLLFSYAYPRNVRELELGIRSAVAFAAGGQVQVEHLPTAIRLQKAQSRLPLGPQDILLRRRLQEVLAETHGNVAAAGRALNKAPMQVRRWCRRLSIDIGSFR